MIQLTPEMLYGFTTQFLLSGYDDPVPIPELHMELWQAFCSGRNRVAVAAPRAHAKSTAGTHAYTLANMLFRARQFAVIVSDTSTQAEEFLGNIKRELEENEELKQAFGVKRFVKDNENTLIVELEGTDHNGRPYYFRISAKGSGKSLRGLNWRQKRPDLIICDDLENDEMVESDERREKFRRWFRNALMPCGSKRCLYRVVGTILHFDSLLNRLMPDPESEDTVDTPLKMYSKSDKRAWLALLFRAHDETFEHILWPEMFSQERLESIRQDYVEDGNPEGYAQEYLNNPIAQENAYFRKENLIDFREETHGPWEYYIGGDLAISEVDKAAYSVLAVVGVNADGMMRLFHVERFRGDGLEIINTIFNLNDIFRPEMFFFEQENIMRTIKGFLDNEMIDRNQYFNYTPINVTKDKMARARPMQARVRANRMEFDHESKWWAKFMMEAMQFPKGAFKDQIDALSIIFQGLQYVSEAPTAKELEDEEYEEEVELYEEAFSSGRSMVCGY